MGKYNVEDKFYRAYKKPNAKKDALVNVVLPLVVVVCILYVMVSVIVYGTREQDNYRRLEMILATDGSTDPALLKSGIMSNITVVVNGESVKSIEGADMYPKYQRSKDISLALQQRALVMPPGTRLIIREDKDLSQMPLLTIIKLTDGYLCGTVYASKTEDKYGYPLVAGSLELIAQGNERGIYLCVENSLKNWR